MEKKKFDLFLEVLKRLQREGVLDKMIIVGSWCVLLYENYFRGKGMLPPIRTRDLEFLIPIPPSFDHATDLPELLKDLGFVLDYRGEQGFMIFLHPDLILEFLVPARGRERIKPYPIAQLGINAQALRFMDLLARNPVQVPFHDLHLTVPHPSGFALQKLLVAGRRKERGKAEKDRTQAVAVLRALLASKEFGSVRTLHDSMPQSWQKTIKHELTELGEQDLLSLMQAR